MVGRLFHYDFEQLSRNLPYAYGLVLALALLFNLFLTFCGASVATGGGELMLTLLVIALFVAVVAVAVLTAVACVVSFYKNCYGRQGYLTFTLPVTSWQILSAHTLSALLLCLLSTAVIGAAALLALPFGLWPEFFKVLVQIPMDSYLSSPQFAGFIAAAVFAAVAQALLFLMVVYLSISIGQLFSAGMRIPGAIIAYFVINAVIEVLGVLVLLACGRLFEGVLIETVSGVSWFIVGGGCLALALAAVCALGTEWLMRRKLNLE